MKNKQIFVFLKNKIISLDSIIPFAMEMNKNCGFEFVFIVFDLGTYNAIEKDNIVLNDAIKSIGSLNYIHSLKNNSKVLRKFFFIYKIFDISLKVNFNDSYILHFGGLNEKPLVFLRWLFLFKKRILCESSSNGRVISQENLEIDSFTTKNASSIYQYRTDSLSYFKSRNEYAPLHSAILLGFDDSWNYFKHNASYKAEKIIYQNSRNSPVWVDFLAKNSDNYLDKELAILGSNSMNIISIVIGRIMLGYDDEKLTRLHAAAFKNTLISLAKHSADFPIFIKPKVYDDMTQLRKFINEIKREYKINFILTELHPMVLARRSIASFFVSNTSVINDFYLAGVPVIQNLTGFSGDYLEKMTSSRADYVVNDSDNDLSLIINNIVNNSKQVYNNTPKKIESNLDYKVFL
jgi:hypothetical protein